MSALRIVGAVVMTILLMSIGVYVATNATKQTHEITIDKIWTKASPNDDKAQIYHVSDVDGNVYCVKDITVLWKFDVSDRWAQLDEGETYVVTTVGWRIRFASMYPNIIEIEEV